MCYNCKEPLKKADGLLKIFREELFLFGKRGRRISLVFLKRGVSCMFKEGFSNEKYVQMQSQKIRDRIGKFGGKLYLEFGSSLSNASRMVTFVPAAS